MNYRANISVPNAANSKLMQTKRIAPLRRGAGGFGELPVTDGLVGRYDFSQIDTVTVEADGTTLISVAPAQGPGPTLSVPVAGTQYDPNDDGGSVNFAADSSEIQASYTWRDPTEWSWFCVARAPANAMVDTTQGMVGANASHNGAVQLIGYLNLPAGAATVNAYGFNPSAIAHPSAGTFVHGEKGVYGAAYGPSLGTGDLYVQDFEWLDLTRADTGATTLSSIALGKGMRGTGPLDTLISYEYVIYDRRVTPEEARQIKAWLTIKHLIGVTPADPVALPVEPTWRFYAGDLWRGNMTGRQWNDRQGSNLNFRIPVGNDAVPRVEWANGFRGVRFSEDQQTTMNPRLELYDGETPFGLEPGCTVFVVYTGETDEPGRYRVMMGNQENAGDSHTLCYRTNSDSFNAYLDDLDGWTVRLHHDDIAVNTAAINDQPPEAAIGMHVAACRGTRETWESLGAPNDTYVASVLNGLIHEVVIFDRASAPTDQEMTDTVAALMAYYGVEPVSPRTIDSVVMGAQANDQLPLTIVSPDAEVGDPVYFVMIPDGDPAPSAAQIKEGDAADNTAAPDSGNFTWPPSGSTTHTLAEGLNDDFRAHVTIDNIGRLSTPGVSNAQAIDTTVTSTFEVNNLITVLTDDTAVSTGENRTLDLTLDNTGWEVGDLLLIPAGTNTLFASATFFDGTAVDVFESYGGSSSRRMHWIEVVVTAAHVGHSGTFQLVYENAAGLTNSFGLSVYHTKGAVVDTTGSAKYEEVTVGGPSVSHSVTPTAANNRLIAATYSAEEPITPDPLTWTNATNLGQEAIRGQRAFCAAMKGTNSPVSSQTVTATKGATSSDATWGMIVVSVSEAP